MEDYDELITEYNNPEKTIELLLEEAKRKLEQEETRRIQDIVGDVGEIDWRPTETIPEDYYAL